MGGEKKDSRIRSQPSHIKSLAGKDDRGRGRERLLQGSFAASGEEKTRCWAQKDLKNKRGAQVKLKT